MNKSPFIYLVIFLFAVTITAQEQHNNSGKGKINYRRTETSQLPTTNFQQPKKQVFPLGWNTRTLGKVTSGTGIWTELNPNVPRVDYIGIDFVNPDTGWACGGSGAIIKTTNGGDDWTIAETPITNLLLKVHSYIGQVVIVTGYDGLILRSSDGGETFEQVPSGVGSGTDLWGVQMLNDTLGWVCGLFQTLLKTTDAGQTWQQVFPGLNQHYWSLNFLNEQYGMIACGGGIVLKTTDGGNLWTQTQAGDTRALYTIDIIDSLHIAAAGAGGGFGGKNVYSSDGGVTWIQNGNMIYENGVNCVAFINTDTGYVVGENWVIRKTTNRGVSWFASDPVGSEWWIKLLPDGYGYTAGDELKIFKTEGGYDNWEKLFFTDNIDDVFFIDENKGFIIVRDPARLYKTTNGGQSWDSIPGAPGGVELLFLNSLTGFIGSNLIYKTTDGGEIWYETNGAGGAGKIFFINPTVGWAERSNKIYKTIDGGENWFTQLTLPADNFTSIFFVDLLNGWATSRYIWQTTDGGNNWIQRTDIPITFSTDVYFPGLDTGWIGRYSSINNSLFKTTDGGLNWIAIPEVIGARKFYFFPDPIHWLIIGFSRYYVTNDYGNSWIEFTNDVPTGISSFQAPTNTLGYAVGSGGLILRYDDTTYVPVELISFEGKIENEVIVLSWITANELNNLGFYIEKSSDKISWERIGFVNGNGTTTETNYYNFVDMEPVNGEISYRLMQQDYDGSSAYSRIITVYYNNTPTTFELFQNYPNPFNPKTTIKYSVPNTDIVNISLYSILGDKITELINEEKLPGVYKITLDANNLASGIYFYTMVTGSGFTSVKKLTIIK